MSVALWCVCVCGGSHLCPSHRLISEPTWEATFLLETHQRFEWNEAILRTKPTFQTKLALQEFLCYSTFIVTSEDIHSYSTSSLCNYSGKEWRPGCTVLLIPPLMEFWNRSENTRICIWQQSLPVKSLLCVTRLIVTSEIDHISAIWLEEKWGKRAYLLVGLKMKNELASGMGTAFSFNCSSARGRGLGLSGISGSSSSSSPAGYHHESVMEYSVHQKP